MTPSTFTHDHLTRGFGIESSSNLGDIATFGASAVGVGTVSYFYLLSRLHLSFVPVLGIGSFFRGYAVVHAATTGVQTSLLT